MEGRNPITEKVVSLLTEAVIREDDKDLTDKTGEQMAAILYRAMPNFDLLINYNLKATFDDPNAAVEVLQCAMFIAILQHRLYCWRRENGHGRKDALDEVCDALYVWKNRLHASYVSKRDGTPRRDGNWLN